MRLARLFSFFLLVLLSVTPAWCGTELFMHQVTSPVVGYQYATTTVGQGTTTSITTSVSGPTSGVQLTQTAGGPVLVWISPPLSTATTISGPVTMNAEAEDSSSSCHCGLQVTLQKYSDGSEDAAFLASSRGTALTTSFSQQNWNATPTSTSFAAGDRIVVKWWIIDAGGTMSRGKTVTFQYDNTTTWVQFTETLSFQSEPEVIQNKNGHVNGQNNPVTSVGVTLNPTAAGHVLVVVITADGPTYMVTSVADNGPQGGCAYIEAPNALDAVLPPQGGNGEGAATDIWYCPNSSAGTTSVTVDVYPGSDYDLTAWVYEVSGLDTTSPLDVSGKVADFSNETTHAGFFLTTAEPMEFIVQAEDGWGNVTSVSSPWTLDATPGGDASVYLTGGGTFQPTFTNTEAGPAAMSAAAFWPPQSPSVNAGPNQTITWPTNTVTLNGTVIDNGHTLTISWSQVSGPGTVTFSSPTTAVTQATFSAIGTYVVQLSGTDDQHSSTSTATVTVNTETVSLTLTPAMAGPNVVGTNQTLTAVLKNATTGAAISGASVQFTVAGPNATSGTATTSTTGTATFTYEGNSSGTDTVQASTTSVSSNTATVSWVVPVQAFSTSTVLGDFFFSDGSGSFDTLPTATPAFTQAFPTINFNPLAGTIPGNTSNVGVNTRPFTDVTTDLNGNFTGTIIAQGNQLQAGVGPLSNFQAVFRGVFTVASAGDVSLNLFVDDGFILGIGGGATQVSGPMTNAPASGMTAFDNLPVLGAFNEVPPGGPTGYTVVVNFPAAGTYPYELDYSECCGGQLTLTMAQTGSTVAPLVQYRYGGTAVTLNGTTQGNAILVAVGSITNTPPTVYDSQGNTYYPLDQISAGGSPLGGAMSLYLSTNVPGGNVTIYNSSGCNTCVSIAMEWMGIATDAASSSSSSTLTQVNPSSPFNIPLGPVNTSTSCLLWAGLGFTYSLGSASWSISPPSSPWIDMDPSENWVVYQVADAGTYSYDFTGTWSGIADDGAVLVALPVTAGIATTNGVPPTGSLVLTPTNPSPLAAGQTQTFTVVASNASGAVVQNATVTLIINGANQLILTATTNATGQATFQYSGANAGTDTLQAVADTSNLGSYSDIAFMTWTVPTGGGGGSGGNTVTFAPQGWLGSPTIGTVVQGQVPITVASGITLASGTLTYWPTSNPSAVTTLNANTTGSGTIGTFDATLLASGGYMIQLNATANGVSQVSQITVSVVGANKPGRMTATVTEFNVPLAGIPIAITRTYDSLDRGTVEDFGFGWKVGTFVNLQVDAQNNVTFNFGGQRVTFFFTPQPTSWLFPWLLTPTYTPQAGLHGSLTSNGCGGVVAVESSFVCFLNSAPYQPTTYVYTDPVGRTYTISASGQLQSIQDLHGDTLTVASSGITSSVNGVVVPFVRDGQGRITQITDPNGNHYTYSYDSNGNLQSVQYPALTAAETYTYASDHSLLSETDPRGDTSSATYYSNGRLETITDTMGDTWSYSYNLTTNTKTTTYPDGGVGTETDDSFGNPLSITDPLNRTTTYTYDANENLISMTDPLTKTTTYTYDINGFQTSVTDPLGHMSTKTYNQFGGVLTATDAANTNTQTTSYDANFDPIQVTDALGQVSASTYDSMGDPLTVTDANGKTTQLAFDPTGDLIQVTDALNEASHFSYDTMGRITSQTDPLGNVTQFTYDALGRLITRTDALHDTTTYAYDNNGNKTSETDALNRTTSYQYDNMNRVSKITYPDHTTTQYTYDFRGNKLTAVDQLGRTTKYVYDLAGQLTSVTYAYGTSDAGTVSYTYDLDGRQQTVKDELGNTTTSTYDAAGRLTSVQDALSHVTNYAYDADNRKTSVTDANSHTTSYAYDARSRLTTLTYPDTTTTKYTYDGVGRLLTTTDQAGLVTTKTYNAVGRLTSVADAIRPTPNVTQYAYDLNGNLVQLQDAAGRLTFYQYDQLNRRIVKTLPLGMAESYSYDAVGNLATKNDSNQNTTTYSYDALNRLLSKVPDPSLSEPTISFTYTQTGQRASMTDASGTTNYSSYDNRDRLKTKATPEGTLSYTYDAHGNVLTIASSNANGASMTYTYDALNRLASAKDNRIAAQGGPSTPTTYSYDAVGNLAGYADPNTVQTGNVFDTLNRLTQTCAATSSPACSAGTKLASYAYTLGAAGNRLSVAEQSGRTVNYGYDNDYRLASEAITSDPGGNNGTVGYSYDAVGNRTQMTSTLNAVPPGSFFYDANDQLTTDTYDANGNTISSGGISYSYDFENRMLTRGAVTIVYDGDGNRVSETAAGVTTKYLVDTLNPTGYSQVVDELVSGSVTRTYAYGLQRISENQLASGTWTPSFYGYDGHGNVRFLTNTSGAVGNTYQFDAFGNQIASTGTTPNNYLYSGEQYDSGLNLLYLRARYYRMPTGRFLTRDPVEGRKCCGLSWNPYIYVKDNATNAVDPAGREAFIEWLWQYRKPIAYVTAAGILGRYLFEAFELIPEELERALPPDIHDPGAPEPGYGGPGPEPAPISGPPVAGED